MSVPAAFLLLPEREVRGPGPAGPARAPVSHLVQRRRPGRADLQARRLCRAGLLAPGRWAADRLVQGRWEVDLPLRGGRDRRRPVVRPAGLRLW